MQKDLPGKLGMSTPDTLDDLVAALKEVKSRGLTGFNDQPMFPLGFGAAAAVGCLRRSGVRIGWQR